MYKKIIFSFAGLAVLAGLLIFASRLPGSKEPEGIELSLAVNLTGAHVQILEDAPVLAELTLFYSPPKGNKSRPLVLRKGLKGWMRQVEFQVRDLKDQKAKRWNWKAVAPSAQDGRLEIPAGELIVGNWAVSPADRKKIRAGKYQLRALWKNGKTRLQSQPLAVKILERGKAPESGDEIRQAQAQAYFYYIQGDMKQAEGVIRKAMEKFPTQRELLVFLGDIQKNSGDEKAALETYRKALHASGNKNGMIFKKYRELWGRLSGDEERQAALRATIPAGTKKPLPDDVLQILKQSEQTGAHHENP